MMGRKRAGSALSLTTFQKPKNTVPASVEFGASKMFSWRASSVASKILLTCLPIRTTVLLPDVFVMKTSEMIIENR
eukprot:m.96558 g.96558  ORF g.96558 m.96558 type:complete len:76 (+) comp12366_c0_seq1:370-597(+)